MEIHTVSMKNYSALRIGGEAELCYVHSIRDSISALSYAKQSEKQIIPLGEGTNSYFGNSLSKYLFIKNEIHGISLNENADEVLLTIGAGEKWDDIVQFVVSKEYWGIENLSLIPGTVGAAPVQNIGAYGVELKDVFVSLSAYDTKNSNVVEITKEACDFGYRDSLFKKEKNRYIILDITIKLSKISKSVLTYKPLDVLLGKEGLTVSEVRELVIATRKAKLPDYREFPNTGSFFKNPIVTKKEGEKLRESYPVVPLLVFGDAYKIPAAWLIEHVAEMKGVRNGDVGTWPNQPLVLVNYGEATCSQVEAFVSGIVEKIYSKTGVTIEKEVNFVE